MIHKRDPQFATFDSARRNGWLDVGNESWRWLRTAGQLPPQQIKPAASLRRVGIVKTLSVRVLLERRLVGRLAHAQVLSSLFQDKHSQPRSVCSAVIQTLSRFNEIRSLCSWNVEELLRVPVDKRKPGALHLNHDGVP